MCLLKEKPLPGQQFLFEKRPLEDTFDNSKKVRSCAEALLVETDADLEEEQPIEESLGDVTNKELKDVIVECKTEILNALKVDKEKKEETFTKEDKEPE